MASSSRSAQFTQLHKVLKKHYQPVAADPERPVLEHLLFACCLEDAHHNVAEESYAAVVEAFFDWNEIRVSSVRELAEVMARLPDPPAAGSRVKRVLQHVFEDNYSFDLEELRKKNLGPAVEELKKIDGVDDFAVAYVVQSALGGHSIALDAGTLEVMRILDLASDKDVEQGVIPGLERAIAKRSGIEFASLLHQLGADFTENPFAPELKEKLLEIDPGAKSRLPKRGAKKKKKSKKKAAPADKPREKPADKGKVAETAAKAASDKAKKKTVVKKKSAAKKKVAKKRIVPAKKKTAASKTKSSSESGKKKTPGAGISKRKPR